MVIWLRAWLVMVAVRGGKLMLRLVLSDNIAWDDPDHSSAVFLYLSVQRLSSRPRVADRAAVCTDRRLENFTNNEKTLN